MPAVSLSCRVCATEHPLVANGSCSQCFGPLDPDLRLGSAPRSRQPRLDRGRPAVDLALRRPAARHGAGGRPARAGHDAARAGSPPRRGARDRRALAQARYREPDPLVQGSRRRRGGPEGAGARARHALLLVDRQPRRRRRGARSRRGPRRCRLRPERPRAGEARGRRGLRPADLRGQRHLRPLLATLGGAVVRAAVGLRQRQSALVLRRGVEDARLRDRGAARLGDAGRRRDPDRVGRALPQGRPGLRRAAAARPDRRRHARRSSVARPQGASPSRPPSATERASCRCGPTASRGRSRSAIPPTATSPSRRRARRAVRSTPCPRTRSGSTWPSSRPRPASSARPRRASRSARSRPRSPPAGSAPQSRVVLLVTGDGLKTPGPVAHTYDPIMIEADADAFVDEVLVA